MSSKSFELGRRSFSVWAFVLLVFALTFVRGPAAIDSNLALAQTEFESPDGLPAMDDGSDSPPPKKRSVKKIVKPKAKSAPKPTPRPKPRVKVKPAVEDEELAETEEPVSKPKAKAKKVAANAVKKKTKKISKEEPELPDDEAEESTDEEAENLEDEGDDTESTLTEERDPVKISSNARELAIRSIGTSKISVSKTARKYIPKDFEVRLAERLIQELNAKTYFEPQAIDVAFNMRTRKRDLQAAAKKANVDGLLVFEIGLEEIRAYLASVSGRRIRSFEFRYKVGEMDEKNVVSLISERIIEGFIQAIPYRGFVTASEKNGATVNLGSNHSVQEGDVLELFEFRRPNFNSTQKMLMNVKVVKVVGPAESQVALTDATPKGTRIPASAKVAFSLSKSTTPVVAATDHSVVSGKWWFGFGAEIESLGAEAAAPQYESKVFKVNSAPFAYASGGNDLMTFHAAFGSGRSESETLGFFDLQGTYAIYQLGGAQSAWTIAAGARLFFIQVTPNPQTLSALESTTIVSPIAELKYQYVPRGRIRLVGLGEIFWPIYTNGAAIGALPFAFGAGVGGGLQLALTSKFGMEVSGKVRYLRRPIDGQSGVQERQSILRAGLIFSF